MTEKYIAFYFYRTVLYGIRCRTRERSEFILLLTIHIPPLLCYLAGLGLSWKQSWCWHSWALAAALEALGPTLVLPARATALQAGAQPWNLHFCSAPWLVCTAMGSHCGLWVHPCSCCSVPTRRLRERSEREQRMQALWESGGR